MGGRSNYGNNNNYNSSNNSGSNQNYNNSSVNNSGLNRNRSQSNASNNNNYNNTNISGGVSQTIVDIIPVEITENIEIKIDHELNSLYVTGTSAKIERLKDFIKYIDKTVPVVLIEVMFIEVSKNNTTETGVTWGIGDEPSDTKGSIFPKIDFALGAKAINKVITPKLV